jgi:hypothetical protein
MKTDFYTKTILTVIAIALTLTVLKDYQIIPTATASVKKTESDSRGTISEEITDFDAYRLVKMSEMNTMDVRIVDISTYDELQVNIKSIDSDDELNVNLKSIKTTDELDVNIDEVGGRSIFSGSAIPVKLEQ